MKNPWRSFQDPPENESVGTKFELKDNLSGDIFDYVIVCEDHHGIYLKPIGYNRSSGLFTYYKLISALSINSIFSNDEWRYLEDNKLIAFL